VFWCVAAVGLAALLASCRSPQTALQPPSPPQPPQVSALLEPGDVIDVKFFYTPELDESQAVRPDGKITLQLVGEVDAANKTPLDLRDEISELYLLHLRNPEISVIVRSTAPRQVLVTGQVLKPGAVEMPKRITVLDAVAHAGGLNFDAAEIRNVLVIRQTEQRRFGYSIDLRPSLRGEETEPFFLEPYDIVYVPRTRVVQIGQWIDQHINRIVPQFGFRYSQAIGDGTIGIDTASSRR